MDLTVKPAQKQKGTIRLPSSKSYSIRAYLIAACGGRSTIVDPSNCEDALVAKRIAGSLGAKVRSNESRSTPTSYVTAGKTISRTAQFDVGESGTVLRILLPLLGRRGKTAIVTGKGTLRGRPNADLTSVLRKMGVNIKGTGKKEGIPLVIKRSEMTGGDISINAGLSSQFVSALLITCPMLGQSSKILLKGRKIVSSDYVAMTIQTLRASGIKVQKKSDREYRVKGNQRYKGLGKFRVPSDYGLAAFLIATALLHDSDVKLKGYLTKKFIQADGHIIPLLRKMGAKMRISSEMIHVKGPSALKGGQFSLKSCPDLVPIMSVLALFAKGRTKLTNIGHVRTKESDRISDLRKELVKIGASVKETRDSLTIIPQSHYDSGRTLNPHRDHRLAMAFSVLGSKIGVRVKDIECTHKSYPDFIRDFKSLGNTMTRF